MIYRDNPLIRAKYQSKQWQKVRNLKIAMQPFCERCLLKGIYTPAKIVHHKEYITDENYFNDNVFFNLDNLESICISCHNEEHFADKKEYYFDNEGNLVKK